MQNTEFFSQNTESFFMGCTGLGSPGRAVQAGIRGIELKEVNYLIQLSAISVFAPAVMPNGSIMT